jgi:DNA polymerase elongation subunit (family B)
MGGACNTRETKKKKHYYFEDEGGDVDNIKIDLKPMGWKGVDWINLAQNIPQ